MTANPHTVCVLFSISNQHYKTVACYVLTIFWGVRNRFLLVVSTNCRLPVLVYKFALRTTVNSFNVEWSRFVS